MRGRVTNGTLTVQAVAGTYTVLLGMSLSRRTGILGFAIHRTDHTEGDCYWLRGLKTFASTVPDPQPGQTFPLNRHPIQGFQWGDYTAKPGHRYTYRVVALGGTPTDLTERASATVDVTTEHPDDGVHGIWFNRGVAASQAFLNRFGHEPLTNVPDDDPRLVWLSRGLGEAFLDTIAGAADDRWGIRGAFYEFAWPAAAAAFARARDRGVDVRLVIHGRDRDAVGSVNDNDQTAAQSRTTVANAGISDLVTWRVAANKSSLQHNKFLVLTRNGLAVSVWTGSTNLTRGGIFGHSNVGHLVRDAEVASRYLEYWEQLEAPVTTKELRMWSEATNPVDLKAIPVGTSSVFSPRSTQSDLLNAYATAFDEADSSAHITGAFGLNAVFLAKLDRERAIPRTVLLDTLRGFPFPPTDRDVRVSSGAHIQMDRFGQWAREWLTGFNTHVRYVHTKIIMVDPLTDDPLIATGSANYSNASVTSNEENTLLIRGDTRVADIYLTEYHRLFMHFPFRKWASRTGSGPRPLREDDSWSDDYYDPGHWRLRQRRLFSGG